MRIINNKNLRANINEEGAYVESFIFKDKEVFFDKKSLPLGDSLKIRGGMHVCAPNFSDDKLLNELPSHGFGRDESWKVVDYGNDYLKLGLKGLGSYKDVYFEISYKLLEDGLKTRLTIENKGEGKIPLAPAFHPYFATKFEDLKLYGHDIEKKDLPDSIFIDTDSITFSKADMEVQVKGNENVGTFTVWTDFLDDYICIEPTLNGKSFLDDDLEPLYLDGGKTFVQEFDILIKNI